MTDRDLLRRPGRKVPGRRRIRALHLLLQLEVGAPAVQQLLGWTHAALSTQHNDRIQTLPPSMLPIFVPGPWVRKILWQ